jgi:hypothetical protein
VVRDPASGVPIPDNQDPTRYQPRYINAGAGTVVPAIGLIVEL